MTNPRRFAALAVCLLALASGAAAAADDCVGKLGNFEMDIISATGADGPTHEVAKCLYSAKVTIDKDCKVTVEPNAATGGITVPALWAKETAKTYAQFQECPSAASEATSSDADDADLQAAITSALNKFVYGGNKDSDLVSTAIAAGVVTVKNHATAATATLVYAIKKASFTGWSAIKVVTAADLASYTTAFKETAGDECDATDGRYGIVMNDNFKLCPLCPAGTTGDGNGCTSCAGGKWSGVGATTCTSCLKGTYAEGGNSDCLPCPTGTYTGSDGESQCAECPNDSYAWIPGSAGCLRCINGVPKCVAGDITGFDCTQNTGTGSPGSHILSVGTAGNTCAVDTYLTASGGVPIWRHCTSWQGTPTLQLALLVNGDCSITVRPITDESCADPGAVDLQKVVGVKPDVTYGYTYNDLLVRAYYQTPAAIRSLMPAGVSTSFMFGLDLNSGANLQLTIWAASTLAAQADDVSGTASCSSTATVIGGKVAGSSEVTACPAGSYAVTDEYCYPCPQGYFCVGGSAKTACDANEFNRFLGAKTDTCVICSTGAPRQTSYAGSAYCTIPYVETECGGGKYFDQSKNDCVPCEPGTKRASGDNLFTCSDCAAGEYSGAGATTCSQCPKGQYSPSSGLGDQTLVGSTINCLRCPKGSIALANGQSISSTTYASATPDYRNQLALSDGADHCEACPSGTWADPSKTEAANALGCSLCGNGLWRNGDASAENNACKRIPAGYRATELLDSNNHLGAFTVGVCKKGSVSYWKADNSRVPTDGDACRSCADESAKNSYAPRDGMTACIACKGGFIPDDSDDAGTDAAGPDVCIPCSTGLFRSFYTNSATCATCAAGYEVGPSNRQACTQCRPGNYKADATGDFCSECPQNMYMARPGATACQYCPKGYETLDTGNTECSPCPVGFYNKAAANAQTSGRACVEAPAGSFVNSSAAYFFTLCPLGTFNDKTGQDSCDPCAPGQYANTLGSRSCKTCPAGTFSAGKANTCTSCRVGYYSPAGAGACSPCKPGTYTSSARAATCTLCPKGSQCPTPATSTPRACPAGYFSAKDGSTLCTPCPVNFYQSGTGQTKCLPCAVGTNTRGLTGQKACQAVRITTLRRSVL